MDVRDRVDPAYRALMEQMAANPVDWSNPAKVRADRAALMPAPEVATGVDWADHAAPGPTAALDPSSPGGAPDVTVRTYRKTDSTGAHAAIYWIHGGGYMGGTHDGNNDTASEWARDLGAVVASVDYRLAPEHPYPAPIEDCYAGLKWLVANAARLGVDPNRIIIAGGSAGAGLAAALALLVRDRGELNVTHQVLIYPMIDDTRTTASSQWTSWVWTKESNNTGWRAYLGDLFGTDAVPPYAAPTRATNLAGLPAAYVMVGTLDLFLDEDLEYARRLIEAGVPTELKVYPGAPHGFDTPRLGGKAELGKRAHGDTKDYLRRAIASTA
ncbi:MAG: alpha/beta hydrolase [Chloroflexi bacterium]|nr:alpha/beta hydrolase [Chloroflexota bacterium]MDA1145354.1 alpha/beta hydrolase [Chloroflexota bacterium]